jgi:hypothetical protein
VLELFLQLQLESGDLRVETAQLGAKALPARCGQTNAGGSAGHAGLLQAFSPMRYHQPAIEKEQRRGMKMNEE